MQTGQNVAIQRLTLRFVWVASTSPISLSISGLSAKPSVPGSQRATVRALNSGRRVDVWRAPGAVENHAKTTVALTR